MGFRRQRRRRARTAACTSRKQGTRHFVRLVWIDHRIRDYRGIGTMQDRPFLLGNAPKESGDMRKVRQICVISRAHVRKLLQIKRLQNSLYGRLSRRRCSCPGGRPWVRIASGEAQGAVFGEPGVLLVANLMLEIASIRNLLRVRYALD